MHRVSWIGLGNIGMPICRNLARNGPLRTPITVWNRTHQTALDLATGSDEIIAAGSIEDAVLNGDIICLCLLDDAAVRDVITTAVRDTDVKGKLFVDFSTIHPDTAASESHRLQSQGAEYLACPIFGGSSLATDRQITLVLAGSSESIEKFYPFTEKVICKEVIILANCPCQQASTLKLIGNFIRFSTIEVLCEASVLAEKSGLPYDTLLKFVTACIPGVTATQLNMLHSGSYHRVDKGTIPIAMAVKENSHLNDLAQKHGASLRTLNTITSHVDNVVKRQGPNASLLAILGIIREECGLTF